MIGSRDYKQRLSEITPYPWDAYYSDNLECWCLEGKTGKLMCVDTAYKNFNNNFSFIVDAPEIIADLLAENERLRME